LFLIYINDLNKAIKFCKVHHFADDTNLLHVNRSIKSLNKYVNYDLKNLTTWLNANKISLNVSKTELIIFKPKNKPLDFELKIKINGKRLEHTPYVTYLGVKIDENLTWNFHIDNLSAKLNRANAMLSKIRHYVDKKTLKSIYYSIFQSHLIYSCLSWAQNLSAIKRLVILQRKAIRLMEFLPRRSHTSKKFNEIGIIKFHDHIKIENCLFINNCINEKVPAIFKDWFTLVFETHNHATRHSNAGTIVIKRYQTKRFGRLSFINSAINHWNYLQKQFKEKIFYNLKTHQLKSLLKKYFIDSYFNDTV